MLLQNFLCVPDYLSRLYGTTATLPQGGQALRAVPFAHPRTSVVQQQRHVTIYRCLITQRVDQGDLARRGRQKIAPPNHPCHTHQSVVYCTNKLIRPKPVSTEHHKIAELLRKPALLVAVDLIMIFYKSRPVRSESNTYFPMPCRRCEKVSQDIVNVGG